MRYGLLIAGAAAILLATGIAHGLRTDRWGEDQALTDAVRRLQDVPTRVGEWTSVDTPLDERQIRAAQISGHVARRFTHEPTGRSVVMLLLVGRPGAIGAHSPDVCYTGSGFRLSSERKVRPLGPGAGPEFAHAIASKSEPRPEHLSLWWAWSTDGGSWACPSSPRGYYWRSPVLYKLYLVRPVGEPKPADDITPSLMEELVPRLAETLSPRD
jgi:hypothetical protein